METESIDTNQSITDPTEEQVRAAEEKAFKPLIDAGVNIKFSAVNNDPQARSDQNQLLASSGNSANGDTIALLSLADRQQIANSYTSPSVTAELKALGEEIKTYKELTGDTVTLNLGPLHQKDDKDAAQANSMSIPDVGLPENKLVASGEKDNLTLNISFNQRKLNLAREHEHNGTTPHRHSEPLHGGNLNELPEVRLRLQAANALLKSSPDLKSSPHKDLIVNTALVAALPIAEDSSTQLATYAIDVTLSEHSKKTGIPHKDDKNDLGVYDAVEREKLQRQHIHNASPEKIVASLNTPLSPKIITMYKESSAALRMGENGAYDTRARHPDLTHTWSDLKGDNVQPNIDKSLPTLVKDKESGIVLPNNAAQMRQEFIEQRLNESFPNKNIGVRFVPVEISSEKISIPKRDLISKVIRFTGMGDPSEITERKTITERPQFYVKKAGV
jgi:hypothetical protein